MQEFRNKLTVPQSYYEERNGLTINTEQRRAKFNVIFRTTYLQTNRSSFLNLQHLEGIGVTEGNFKYF
jgi:hypothetical protein